MATMSIRQLISIYDELDNAIFFDGIGEFLRNENYTNNIWKDKACQFLDEYQKLLATNATMAKYDYFLCAQECDTLAEYQAMGIDPTKGRPDEPFEGYFELIHKMSIPITVLRKTLNEVDDCPISQKLTLPTKNVEKIGNFTFLLSDERVVSVQYKEIKLKLQPKSSNTFLCIMRKCYGNTNAISMNEIKAFNKKPADEESNIRKQTSDINRAVRQATGTSQEDKLIVNANEIAPQMFKLNNELLARI